MTDLSDFGVDVQEAEGVDGNEGGEEHTSTSRSYPNGRCPAINVGDRNRCAAPVSRMKDSGEFCGVHGRAADPWTIHDEPRWLIRVTGAKAARCRAVKLDGDRCTNSCGPLEYFCGTHEGWPHETVDNLEQGELDVELIRDAVESVAGAEA